MSLLVSAQQQCMIWDNTTHVDISAAHSKCTASVLMYVYNLGHSHRLSHTPKIA